MAVARRSRAFAIGLGVACLAFACTSPPELDGQTDRAGGKRLHADPACRPPSSSRVHRPTFRLAVIGDFGTGEHSEQAVARAIRERRRSLDALLTTGDNVYDSGDPSDFAEAWAQPYGWVEGTGLNVIASLGNHDVQTDDGRPVMELLGMPRPWYLEIVGDADIFVLDTNRLAEADQTRWLRRALAGSRGAWKIVVFHEPAYSCSRHDGSDVVQERWVPLFEAAGIDLVVNGHDHNYQRFAEQRGVTYVVTGGGGSATLYGLDECPEDYPERVVGNDQVHHFLVIEGSARRLRTRAIAADGRVIDDFTIGADARAVADGPRKEGSPSGG